MNFNYIPRKSRVQAFSMAAFKGDQTVMMPRWILDAVADGTLQAHAVITKHGLKGVNPSDYIVRLEDGSLSPCVAELFHMLYESEVRIAAPVSLPSLLKAASVAQCNSLVPDMSKVPDSFA